MGTNGLVSEDSATDVAAQLHAAGLSKACVQLQTANVAQHESLVQPKAGLSLASACTFTKALVEVGIPVECTAVAHPDVDLNAVEALAVGLGASYKSRPY